MIVALNFCLRIDICCSRFVIRNNLIAMLRIIIIRTRYLAGFGIEKLIHFKAENYCINNKISFSLSNQGLIIVYWRTIKQGLSLARPNYKQSWVQKANGKFHITRVSPEEENRSFQHYAHPIHQQLPLLQEQPSLLVFYTCCPPETERFDLTSNQKDHRCQSWKNDNKYKFLNVPGETFAVNSRWWVVRRPE